MNRAELIDRLHQVHICVTGLVVTYDMGVQFDVITSQGATTNIGNLGSWPIVNFPIDDSFRELIHKLQSGIEVTDEELIADRTCRELTTYHDLYEKPWLLEGERLSTCLDLLREELILIDASLPKLFGYVAVEDWNTDIHLFSSEKALQEYVLNIYEDDVKAFEDMDDEELEKWFDKVEEDGNTSLTYLSFFDEEE